jgi:hypothetical protein
MHSVTRSAFFFVVFTLVAISFTTNSLLPHDKACSVRRFGRPIRICLRSLRPHLLACSGRTRSEWRRKYIELRARVGPSRNLIERVGRGCGFEPRASCAQGKCRNAK